eukprot:3113589-Rhodomonas_salina.4
MIVELLLRFGAPVNALEIGGTGAVHIAAQHGYVKVLERLILGGADCNKPNSEPLPLGLLFWPLLGNRVGAD